MLDNLIQSDLIYTAFLHFSKKIQDVVSPALLSFPFSSIKLPIAVSFCFIVHAFFAEVLKLIYIRFISNKYISGFIKCFPFFKTFFIKPFLFSIRVCELSELVYCFRGLPNTLNAFPFMYVLNKSNDRVCVFQFS